MYIGACTREKTIMQLLIHVGKHLCTFVRTLYMYMYIYMYIYIFIHVHVYSLTHSPLLNYMYNVLYINMYM